MVNGDEAIFGMNAAISDGVTRFEVVDDTGRAYSRHEVNVSLSLADDGRTLVATVKPRPGGRVQYPVGLFSRA